MNPKFSIRGVQDLLEVYEDKVAITPKGVLGFLNKGLKGTKFIPYASITAVQFREAGWAVNGFIQFSIPGGVESRGGVFAATKDENTFMFTKAAGEEAKKVHSFIEGRLEAARGSTRPSNPVDFGAQLAQLAALRAQGALSDSEFQAAKAKLLA